MRLALAAMVRTNCDFLGYFKNLDFEIESRSDGVFPNSDETGARFPSKEEEKEEEWSN